MRRRHCTPTFALIFLALSIAISGCARGSAQATRLEKGLTYVQGSSNPQHLLDLYLPGSAQHKLPLIVWVHGGGWLFGSKEDTPALVLVANGFAVASINYRYSKEAIFPAQLDDCKAAVRWLRSHADDYKIDPDRIGAFGMSAGGHLVALLGTTGDIDVDKGNAGAEKVSSKVQAVCDWCGPADLLTIADQAGKDNELKLRSKDGPVALLLGGLPEKKKQLAKEASPVAFVATGDPPFLIMHGDKDKVVPVKQSEELYQALKEAQVDAQLIIVKDGEHRFVSPATLKQAVDFFHQKLGN